MKRLLSIFAAAVLVISTAFTLTACGEKEITAEAAYEQLTAALTTTVIDADQLSITLKTTVNAKVYDSESDESPAKLEDKKMAVDFGVRATTDENRNVNAGMLWLKITEGEEAVVDVDTYLKEGFTYSHAMISSLNESYSYDEQESPEMLDLSDVSVEEIQEFVNRFKETFPEPTKATVKKETYKLTWKITNNNLPEYITAVRTLSDESITTEEALAIASEVDIKKGEVEITIEGGEFKSLVVDVDAAMGEQSVKARLEFGISFRNVTVDFPEGRLAAIRAKVEEENADAGE